MSLIQIHTIKTFPTSNLNRGEDGKPKSVWYGDKLRGRVSSQAIKAAIRRSELFREGLGSFAVQTRLLPQLIDDDLQRNGVSPTKRQAIMKAVQQIGKSKEKAAKDEDGEDAANMTKQMLRLDPDELSNLASQLSKLYDVDKLAKIEKEIESIPAKAVDLAMFGRMSTSSAFARVDATVQVAHWFSVNQISTESDYLTAIDDLSGAGGLISNRFFNAPVHYGYVAIDVGGLRKNLQGDLPLTAKAIGNFVRAYALVNPSGAQNTFAAHIVPDFMLVEYSERNIPISYAPAFSEPIKPFGSSIARKAITDMLNYAENVDRTYAVQRNRFQVDVEFGGDLNDVITEVKKWVMST